MDQEHPEYRPRRPWPNILVRSLRLVKTRLGDIAKAAAGVVLTEPGLAGIVVAVREGRIGFQQLLTYAFNMLVKKVEIVLFLATGLAMIGQAIMTPTLMVVLFMTNDFLSIAPVGHGKKRQKGREECPSNRRPSTPDRRRQRSRSRIGRNAPR